MSNMEHAIIAESEGRHVSGVTFQQLKAALIECARKCSNDDDKDFKPINILREMMRLRLLALENLPENELSWYLSVDRAVSCQYSDRLQLDWAEVRHSRRNLE